MAELVDQQHAQILKLIHRIAVQSAVVSFSGTEKNLIGQQGTVGLGGFINPCDDTEGFVGLRVTADGVGPDLIELALRSGQIYEYISKMIDRAREDPKKHIQIEGIHRVGPNDDLYGIPENGSISAVPQIRDDTVPFVRNFFIGEWQARIEGGVTDFFTYEWTLPVEIPGRAGWFGLGHATVIDIAQTGLPALTD